jgi:hypothetical protein
MIPLALSVQRTSLVALHHTRWVGRLRAGCECQLDKRQRASVVITDIANTTP